jgi:hypothetical protein
VQYGGTGDVQAVLKGTVTQDFYYVFGLKTESVFFKYALMLQLI